VSRVTDSLRIRVGESPGQTAERRLRIATNQRFGTLGAFARSGSTWKRLRRPRCDPLGPSGTSCMPYTACPGERRCSEPSPLVKAGAQLPAGHRCCPLLSLLHAPDMPQGRLWVWLVLRSSKPSPPAAWPLASCWSAPFCWCWRLRCQRKNALAVLDKLRELGKDPVRAGAETTTYPTPFCPRNDGGGRGRRGPNPLPVPPQVGYR
jgi:hypothetical protein